MTKSFHLKSNKGVLQLSEVNENSVSDEDKVLEVIENETKPKSWRKKLIHKLKKHSKGHEHELQIYKELKLRLSAFQSIPILNPYILVILRLIICVLSIYSTVEMFKEITKMIEVAAGKRNDQLDDELFYFKFGSELVLASINSDRGIMLILLMSMLPLIALSYGYLVGFLSTLYISLQASTPEGLREIEKDLWTEKPEAESKRILRRHKSFWWCRMESCSITLDCALGYALTPLILNFLAFINFKSIPELSIFVGIIIVFLVLLDELFMMKRKFELDAIFKMIKMHVLFILIGLTWLFSIRFFDPSISQSYSNDLGMALFMTVIVFSGHSSGCAFKFLLRGLKPSSPKIFSFPRYSIKPEEV